MLRYVVSLYTRIIRPNILFSISCFFFKIKFFFLLLFVYRMRVILIRDIKIRGADAAATPKRIHRPGRVYYNIPRRNGVLMVIVGKAVWYLNCRQKENRKKNNKQTLVK